MGPGDVTRRKRSSVETRAALLRAAAGRFAREGYEGVSLREIAADAGVDVALVSRYFGGKEELFAEVLAACPDASHLFEGDIRTFGERVARKLVIDPPNDEGMECILIMLRSASSPKAGAATLRMSEERFYGPFARYLGGPDADVRARVGGSIIMGVAIERMIWEDFGLPPEALPAFCARLARSLQAAVEG